MRVGLIAPPWVPVPPGGYGGTESVVDNLARELEALGHDVRLFTVGESTSPVARRHLFATAVEPIGASVPEAAHVLAAYESLTDVDIIHDHTILGPLLAGRTGRVGAPVVTTNHGPFTPVTRRLFAEIARTAWIIAISRDQARQAGVPVATVIHHGIDVGAYRWGSGGGGYLAFVGRMSPDKGVHRAVLIARRAGRPLRIATKMREPAEVDYFESAVRPLLSSDVELEQDVPLETRVDLLRGASALVNPIEWDEPFGLVMVESLATGTPVITVPRGAAPEIVRPGRTGFLCSGDDSAVAAVGVVPALSRHECRQDVLDRFSARRMARDHVDFYERVLALGPRPSRRPPTAAGSGPSLVGAP